MKKFLSIIILSLSLLCMLAPAALAVEAAPAEGAVSDSVLGYHGKAAMAAAVAVTIAAFGCGLGQGLATGKAVEGIARNPGASGQITTPLIDLLINKYLFCLYIKAGKSPAFMLFIYCFKSQNMIFFIL